MKCPTVPTGGANDIQCRWAGCTVRLIYTDEVVSRHINATHKRNSGKMICQWENESGGVCGKGMETTQLRRHVLDIHTTLIVVKCVWCGEEQRKDVMSRHEKTCPQRKKRVSS